MTPEGKIEKYFIKRVKETGGEQRKLKWIGRNGAPDRLAWWPPKLSVECRSATNVIPGDIVPVFAFVELKRPKKGAEDHQTREHNRLRAAGFKVYVADTIEAVDSVILALTS